MRLLLAVLVALALVALGWLWWASSAPSEAAEPVRVVVERGVSTRELGRRLEERGVVRSALLFEAWLRARGDAGRIHAGTYALPRDRALPTVVEMLVEGETVLLAVTVPEGYRLEQTASAVARRLGADSAAFVAAATDPFLVDSLLHDSLGVEGAVTLEGYLYPETYRVDPSTGPREMARLMVGQFWQVFGPSWRTRADSLGRSVHEIVTLASIVEEEAKVPAERPVIAGVFWNRLERGMPLEADPTVQYALGGHRTRVLYRDLEVDSPYNTYRNPGLPPGPIASPGRFSMEATLWPDSVPYLYFFATGEDGAHTFSETFAEHNRKRRELNR
ncbi:MAG: endolytic transglycosylase MltG [Gemmatimonadetes bacterium]|nr:endolytic transglycosylase MltG [Gemmatimonadota bacterium]